MKVRGDFLGPPRSTDKTTLIIKVSNIFSISSSKYITHKKPDLYPPTMSAYACFKLNVTHMP